MSLCCGEWNEDALRAASDRVEDRRRHREAQLEHIVAYAEADSCRRRIVLDHFGDSGSAVVERCCDNCLVHRSVPEPGATNDVNTLSQEALVALVVLDAVRRLKWDVGRTKLAQLLHGSRAKSMRQMGYDKNVYYDRLSHFRQRDIEAMIDQLVSSRYLKAVGGSRPVLRLTPLGREAIRSKASIPLRLPRQVSLQKVADKKAARLAGGTVELTGQLFTEGLTPSQIARQRGKDERTIYGRLARLIEQGRISLSEVVAEEVIVPVRVVIEQLGDVSYLSPIKDLLPEEISFEEIGCVVADWKRERESSIGQEEVSSSDRVTRVVELGNARSPEAVPELIAALADPSGNVRRVATSALGKIGDQRAVEPLIDLLAVETKPQVRQYAVKTLGLLGDSRACRLLKEIAFDETERDYTRSAARIALKRLGCQSVDDSPVDEVAGDEDAVAAFLRRSHPRSLLGPWETGWALDFHSSFAGAKWQRSQVGELTYRLKYEGDLSVVPALVEKASALCAAHPELANVEALLPVPPSQQRAVDPVGAVADALGDRLGLPVWPSVLVKTRHTAPQKEMHTLAQKQANVAGAFAVNGDVRGRRLLVLDDLFDSGATLEEVSRVLQRAGVAQLSVLTFTRTIHADA